MMQIRDKIKPMSKVNLDALIPKADFITSIESISKKETFEKLYAFHLMKDNPMSIYHLLKKPDFQRETNEWDKKRICELIESFIDRSFIPSVILWENQDNGNIYVIDGSHRLSAIIAYINDDYGDGHISHDFNGYIQIPDEERELAEETREYIQSKIGSYKDNIANGHRISDEFKKGYFDVQMITGDVKKAEDSFFKINAQGVVLSPTEKELCRSREYPICIATRSIMKGKSGHQYWRNFESSNQKKVSDISSDLNKILFHPKYEEDLKSLVLDNPLGGAITNAMSMVYEFIKIIKEHYRGEQKDESDVTSGSATLYYLEKARKITHKILSEAPGSLGIHPSVYFYNSSNKYIHSAFLGFVYLLLENENQSETDFMLKFTSVRGELEQFLIKYKMFLGQINSKFGSRQRSFRHMKGFFENLINELYKNKNASFELIAVLLKEKYPFLNENVLDIESPTKRKFTKETRTYIRIKDELEHCQKCKICDGILHPLSISYDHKLDIKYGGGGEPENGQASHFYCNMSKDKLKEIGVYIEG